MLQIVVSENATLITGFGLTVIKDEEEIPAPTELIPFTDTGPLEAKLLKLTVMDLVLMPLVMVAPPGNAQLYPVALAMGGTV